jgi:hypothetical protein
LRTVRGLRGAPVRGNGNVRRRRRCMVESGSFSWASNCISAGSDQSKAYQLSPHSHDLSRLSERHARQRHAPQPYLAMYRRVSFGDRPSAGSGRLSSARCTGHFLQEFNPERRPDSQPRLHRPPPPDTSLSGKSAERCEVTSLARIFQGNRRAIKAMGAPWIEQHVDIRSSPTSTDYAIFGRGSARSLPLFAQIVVSLEIYTLQDRGK